MKPIGLVLLMVCSLAINLVVVLAYDKFFVRDSRMEKIYMFDAQSVYDKKKNELKDMIFKQGLQPTEEDFVDYLLDIDKVIQFISERDHATVVVKTAIASKNIPDITNEVLQIYNKEFGSKGKK